MINKVYSLKEAVEKFVKDGDQLAMGGFTTNRKPYALVSEILRQGQTDFIGQPGPGGGDWDMLIGEGRVMAYINCYTANSGVTNVSRRYRNAIEQGKMLFEDYSQDVAMLMLHASSLGLPYLPVRLMMGTDLVDKWGISKEVRKTVDKLPDDKFVYIDNPFNPGEKTVAVPVPKLDLALIHAQKASPDGTVIIEGNEFHDVDIAIAAKRVIVTCEELISNEEIRKDPQSVSIPCMCVDAVVHVPFGAHPSQCYNYYDYDNPFMREYDVASKTDEAFDGFVKKWVYKFEDHESYVEELGANRLINLRVVPGLGYSQFKEDVK